MNLNSALKLIKSLDYDAGSFLSNRLDEEWGYDEQLIIEIADAFNRWEQRLNILERPWRVSYFDGEKWVTIVTNLRETEAYQLWFQCTSGGNEKADCRSETYYHLGLASEELNGRHSFEEEEDDFSIPYLLNKSFGT